VPYAVYILSNKIGSVLYTGFSSELSELMDAHKNKLVAGFTNRYNVTRLVYYETSEDRDAAGSRADKVALIEAMNPTWRDLSDDL